jgi:hypothetical protein
MFEDTPLQIGAGFGNADDGTASPGSFMRSASPLVSSGEDSRHWIELNICFIDHGILFAEGIQGWK